MLKQNTVSNLEIIQSSARLLGFLTHIPMMSPEEMHDISQILDAFSMLGMFLRKI